MKIILATILFLAMYSCSQNNIDIKKKVNRKDNLEKNIVNNLREDTLFKKMKCGLWKNKEGDIGYQDFDKGASEGDWCGNVYIT